LKEIKKGYLNMEWKLLEPILIGNKLAKNRIVMPPMETRMSTINGDITERMLDYYSERAKGGAGLIIIENTFVDNLASRSSLISSGLYSDHLIAGKNLLAEAIKENGALAIIQLSHGGRQAKGGVTAYEPVAPSAVMCSVTKRIPHALTGEEIVEIEDAFAEAALRAKQAGFDGVEVHGAHGYLIGSFLSPRTNLRNDEYGGSLKNRGRFAANIIKKIWSKVGKEFIVGYRISASEFIEGGLEPEEACGFVAYIQKDIDYISVSAGIYESQSFCNVSSTYVPAGQLIPFSLQMKKAVNIPVIAVGSFNPKLAEQTLKSGHADLIAFGRALIADPQMPNKLTAGRENDIRPCIRGNEGCLSGFYTGCVMKCEVNPACGRESEYKINKVLIPKKVLIIGGGVSGMEAARVAALMGHNVTLMEKENMLGGHLIESTRQEFKVNEAEFLAWLINQIEKSGVNVLLNTLVTNDTIIKEKPDCLVIAVGSEYIFPAIKGAEFAIIAGDILNNTSLAGKKIVVIGGGLVGAETALTLAIEKHEVVILEMMDKIVEKLEVSAGEALIRRLQHEKVRILTCHTAEEIGADYVIAKDKDGRCVTLNTDTTVLATGLESRGFTELKDIIPNTVYIGDCIEARKIYQCTHEAWNAIINTLSNRDLS
jgi:2,4-dienoyl-CoA reductase-like NADH-dependent reductase (Old Yellow Enzyme family)/thioredoxin reductase